MISYSQWELLVKKSNKTEYKSHLQSNNLNFLDTIANETAGKIISYLYNGIVEKIKPDIVSIKTFNKNKTDSKYGHIKINDKIIRLSTCIDIKKEIAYFPKEELKYFTSGDYLYLTNGDLFLIIDNKKLLDSKIPKTSTQLKNYELFLIDIFNNNLVDHIGYIDWFNSKDVETDNGKFNLNSIRLDNKFLITKLRSCTLSFEPKYKVCRIEGSDYENTFEYYDCIDRKAVKKVLGKLSPCKSEQGISNYIKSHTKSLLQNEQNNNIISKKGVSYLIFNINKENDIEKIRLFCKKHIKKYEPKTFRIDWAVKHSKYCKSKEEYIYYKELFLQTYGIKDRYTEEDVQLFKTYNCKFIYKPGINYDYY